MHVAAFIGKLQHFENLKLLYLSTCNWAISPILLGQVTNCIKNHCCTGSSRPVSGSAYLDIWIYSPRPDDVKLTFYPWDISADVRFACDYDVFYPI